MEAQTQTEREGDERRQERLMKVCDADKKGLHNIKDKIAFEGDLTLDMDKNATVAHMLLIDFKFTVLNVTVMREDWSNKQ